MHENEVVIGLRRTRAREEPGEIVVMEPSSGEPGRERTGQTSAAEIAGVAAVVLLVPGLFCACLGFATNSAAIASFAYAVGSVALSLAAIPIVVWAIAALATARARWSRTVRNPIRLIGEDEVARIWQVLALVRRIDATSWALSEVIDVADLRRTVACEVLEQATLLVHGRRLARSLDALRRHEPNIRSGDAVGHERVHTVMRTTEAELAEAEQRIDESNRRLAFMARTAEDWVSEEEARRTAAATEAKTDRLIDEAYRAVDKYYLETQTGRDPDRLHATAYLIQAYQELITPWGATTLLDRRFVDRLR